MSTKINKKRKFVTDGVFYAELNEFLVRQIAADGYSGVEVRRSPSKTEIVIRATQPTKVIGEAARNLKELQSLISKRFNFAENTLDIFVEPVTIRGLDAQSQAESIHYKLMSGLAVRRACYSVIRYIMDAGAKGCEIIISGKLRGQRAQSMKFVEGYMVKSGNAVLQFVDIAIRHAKMRQGILGVKVKIMKPYDVTGKRGVPFHLADEVTVKDPLEEGAAARGFGEKGKPEGGFHRRFENGEKPEFRGDRPRGRGGFRGGMGMGGRGGFRGGFRGGMGGGFHSRPMEGGDSEGPTRQAPAERE